MILLRYKCLATGSVTAAGQAITHCVYLNAGGIAFIILIVGAVFNGTFDFISPHIYHPFPAKHNYMDWLYLLFPAAP
jgi:hypothetical protein